MPFTKTEVDSAVDEQYNDVPKENIVWDDLKAPLTQAKQGNLDKPDFDYTNIGLLFPDGNDTSEIAYIILQFPHNPQNGSDISPHIHWVQAEATTPTWKIDYRWTENGADPTGTFTTLEADNHVSAYTSGSILQISSFPDIDGSGIDSVSSILEVKLYRDDDAVTGDVLAKEFDVHYQIDQIGSRQEFTK